MSRAGAAARVALAATAVAWTTLPGGPWWASIVGGAALWPVLLRAAAPTAAVAAAVVLAPLPGIAFAGLLATAPWAWAIAVVGTAAPFAAAGTLAARVVRGAPAAARVAAWGWAWTGVDLALAHGPPAWPLPPLAPGTLLAESPLAAWAAVGGPSLLTPAWVAASAAVAGTVAGAGGAPGAARRGARLAADLAARLAALLVAASLLVGAGAVALAAGRAAVGSPRAVDVARGVADPERVAATRDDPDAFDAVAVELVARSAPFDPGADLHVWPEAALGFADGDAPRRLAARARAALAAPVLAGAYRPDGDGGWRNAALVVDRGGARWTYDKERLVPGFEGWLRAGLGERWPVRAAGWRWGVLVCWESLFHDLAAARVRAGADALVVLAHDGWAAGGVGADAHARLARALAWSVGRPVVFAPHEGAPRAWGHDGRALAAAGGAPDVAPVAATAPDDAPRVGAAVARFDLRAPAARTTPFVRWGPTAPGALWVVGLVAMGAWVRRGERRPAGRQGCGAPGPHAA